MLGAIAGDIFGAAYEARPIKHEDFDLFDAPRFFTKGASHVIPLFEDAVQFRHVIQSDHQIITTTV